jgi:hypothetical protein
LAREVANWRIEEEFLSMGLHLVCCWPGLAAAWHRANSRSLSVAITFSWLVCLFLLATFVWTEWFNIWILRLGWLSLGCTWIACTIHNHLLLARILGTGDTQSQTAFQNAQQQYLLGNWFDAETILLDLLERYPRDCEALLLLAGVLRRTERWQPALRRLEQLETLDNAAFWRFEVQQERKLIEKRFAEALLR